jgi:hypothetical protein
MSNASSATLRQLLNKAQYQERVAGILSDFGTGPGVVVRRDDTGIYFQRNGRGSLRRILPLTEHRASVRAAARRLPACADGMGIPLVVDA